MHIRIIDAIQEQYGEKYPTLEDALNWWAWPEHWRRGAWDSDFVTGIKTVETAFTSPHALPAARGPAAGTKLRHGHGAIGERRGTGGR